MRPEVPDKAQAQGPLGWGEQQAAMAPGRLELQGLGAVPGQAEGRREVPDREVPDRVEAPDRSGPRGRPVAARRRGACAERPRSRREGARGCWRRLA